MADVTRLQSAANNDVTSPAVGSTSSPTLSDTTDYAVPFRGFHANAAGNIKISMPDGSTPTITVLAGCWYPYAGTRIWSAGTTVANSSIVLLY